MGGEWREPMARGGALFIEFHLVGESFKNDDGSSRQAELTKCSPGEPVRFTLQPDNPHDKNAILVVSARGVGLGHVPKTLLPQIKDALDNNIYEQSRIAHIIGGSRDKPMRGAMIVLTAKGSRYKISTAEAGQVRANYRVRAARAPLASHEPEATGWFVQMVAALVRGLRSK